MLMKRSSNNNQRGRKKRNPPWQVSLLLVVLLSLAACNLPGGLPERLPDSPQRQTEIASILNPTELTPGAATPLPTPAIPHSPTNAPPLEFGEGLLTYTIQQGDTLPALAVRFDVSPSVIQSSTPLSPDGLLPVGLQVGVPDTAPAGSWGRRPGRIQTGSPSATAQTILGSTTS